MENSTGVTINDNWAFRVPLQLLVMGIKKWGQCLFSVQSKIFLKLTAQISQITYQNVQEGSCFTAVGREKKSETFNVSSCSHQSKTVKNLYFFDFDEFTK